jgi:septum formation protein
MFKIILASQSPFRLKLLNDIGIKVDQVLPADIDESELPKETAKSAAFRLAKEKAQKILNNSDINSLIIAADSIAAAGKFILPKAITDKDVEFCLRKISGKKINIFTGVSVASSDTMKIRSKVVHATIECKRLTDSEIAWYLTTKEGLNKAGGFSISGSFQVFCKSLKGQVSTVIGLPLYETKNMLESFGYKLEVRK